MNLYTKVFLGTSVPYGILMGLFIGLSSGVIVGAVSGIVGGLLFGIVMSLILVGLHKLSRKKANIKSHEGVLQSESIVLDTNYENAFSVAEKSIGRIDKGKIIETDKEKRLIRGGIGWSWKSFGEKIEIRLKRIDNDKTKIIFTSRPRVDSTLVDYGKNYQNIEAMQKHIEAAYNKAL